MLIVIKNLAEIHILKGQLKSEFEMKDLGAATKILGRRSKEIEEPTCYSRPRRST